MLRRRGRAGSESGSTSCGRSTSCIRWPVWQVWSRWRSRRMP